MYINDKILATIRNHQVDIANSDFVPVILEAYLQCGVKGIGELKELFIEAKIDMKLYNRAIEKIIKDLLKKSDLLDF